MHPEIDNLKTVLSTEVAVLTHLIGIAQDLNAALIKDDTAGVQRHTHLYDDAAAQIGELEEQRLRLCDSIGKTLGGPQPHRNLQRLIDLMRSPDKDIIAELRQRIKEKIGQLTIINTANRIRLEESIVMITRAFDLILHAEHKVQGYKPSGRKDVRQARQPLFTRIV